MKNMIALSVYSQEMGVKYSPTIMAVTFKP